MKKVLIAFVLFSLLILMDSCRDIRASRNSIQYCDIEQIYIGMPLDSVVQLLGQPYSFNSDLGCHDMTCEHPRAVSDIKMRKETDIIHVMDSIYQDTNYCCQTNRAMMRTIEKKHHAYLHEEAIFPDEHPKILSDAVGPFG